MRKEFKFLARQILLKKLLAMGFHKISIKGDKIRAKVRPDVVLIFTIKLTGNEIQETNAAGD